MDYKTCNTCKTRKPVVAFKFRAHNCVDCESESVDDKIVRNRQAQKRYRDKNKKKVRGTKDNWRLKNKEKSIEYSENTRNRYIEEVRAKDRQRHKDDPYLTRRSLARRKAKKYGARIEKYHPLEIYNRDGGICCICLEWVDLTISAREPKSFTIQHHVSIRNGGADAPDNLGIAHYSCNSSIGNRGTTQHVR